MDNVEDIQEDMGMYEDEDLGAESSEEDDGQPAVTFRYEEDEDTAGNAAKKQNKIDRKRQKTGE